MSERSAPAAFHSLFAYAALRHPEHAASIQGVLAIRAKRYQRNLVTYLSDEEVDALLSACDPTTWTGRRDHAMLLLDVQTGLRISELAALSCGDVTLGPGANVHTVGKGRKRTAKTAGGPHRHRPTNLARRTRRHRQQPALPDRHRKASQPGCHRAPHRPLQRARRPPMPVASRQAPDRPHLPPHLRN